MRKKISSFLSSFGALNLTQFFSALNDNVYKLLLIFLLITVKGPERSNTILALAGAVFVIPFLIFANLAGTLADRFSKRKVIVVTRFIELLVVICGVIAIAFRSAFGGYAVLFLMATQSALFSPAKYGIIPEIVKKQQISRCNGIMTATTYLAIILGTFLASFLSDVTKRNFFLSSFVCLVIGALGLLSSIGIEKTKAQAKEKKVNAKVFSEIIRTLRRSKKIRYLFPTIVFGAYFLFIGAYTQLNIIPFAIQSLHLSEIQGGYLFLMTAIGIGLGSFLAGRLAGKEVELGFVPLAALGLMATLICLYLFSSHFYVVVPLLILLGLLGGFYIIPIDAFIQVASPNQDRGQNVAASNFLNFLGVVVASFLIAFLGDVLGMSAAQGFLVMGIVTLLIAISLLFLMADQVLRLIVARSAQLFWNLKVQGKKSVTLSPPVLLIGQRTSWLDTIVVMATLPRLIRYIVPIEGRFLRGRSFFYRLLRLIPVDSARLSTGNLALKEILKELELGHTVCLMHPGNRKNLDEWQQLDSLLKQIDVPVVPIHIKRALPPKNSGYLAELKSLFNSPIKVSYGGEL